MVMSPVEKEYHHPRCKLDDSNIDSSGKFSCFRHNSNSLIDKVVDDDGRSPQPTFNFLPISEFLPPAIASPPRCSFTSRIIRLISHAWKGSNVMSPMSSPVDDDGGGGGPINNWLSITFHVSSKPP